LRYFTVYGPWGRPDMSPWLFTSAILEGRPIDVFNHGDMMRDFTYVDDVADGTVRVLDRIPQPDPGFDHANPDPATSHAPYRIYNIGNHTPVQLLDFIGTIEQALGREAQKKLLPMQDGDVKATYADVADLIRDTGFSPATSLEYGIERWVAWYQQFTASR
jgi:UDP-glucuronate 4-epimerase